MTDTTAKIRAKGLDATGVTEEIATRVADAESGNLMCVVEISYEALHKKKGGKRSVDFVINTVEPAPNGMTEEHLRELARSFYFERQLHSEADQLAINTQDDINPKPADVIAAGQHLLLDLDDEDDDQDDGTQPHDELDEPVDYDDPADDRHLAAVADPFTP